MKHVGFISILILLSAITTFKVIANQGSNSTANGPQFIFVPNEMADFNIEQKKRIEEITLKVIKEAQKSFPSLSKNITFNFLMVNRDLALVNGITGRADRANSLEITISSIYQGGVSKAIEDSLEVTLFHEIHHIVRGWLVLENRFGHGIDIAAINEGLAEVYSEQEAGHPHAIYKGSPDFDSWTKEILALPVSAHGKYAEWMFQHPDGRQAVGYRTGKWIVKKAMAASGKSIIELTKMSVRNIYALAGYKFRNQD